MKKSAVAEQMLTAPSGATMDEIIAATGGPQYNVLRKLEAKGYRIRRAKEGRATRYWAEPPATLTYTLKVAPNGQTTLPKALRERLGVGHGGRLRVGMEDEGRAFVAREGRSIRDLFGILGRPPVRRGKGPVTLKEMDEAIAEAAVERFLRATRQRK
jgi:bifunctional DNA-binding transcriptional regulator/antitoxin component of YhaV-PrlF toxin-antitoxin module